MVSLFFRSGYVVRLCCFFAASLISTEVYALSCYPDGVKSEKYYATQQEAYNACHADYDTRDSQTGCVGYIICTNNSDYQRYTFQVQHSTFGTVGTYRYFYGDNICPDGELPVNGQCVADCSSKAGQTSEGWIDLNSDSQYTTDGTCNGTLSAKPDSEPQCDTNLDGSVDCYLPALFTYDGTTTQSTSGDPTYTMDQPLSDPLPLEPTYSESYSSTDPEIQTNPDGSTTETQTETFEKTKEPYVSYEQGPNGTIVKVYPDGSTYTMDVTTTTTTNTDGTYTTSTTESITYSPSSETTYNIYNSSNGEISGVSSTYTPSTTSTSSSQTSTDYSSSGSAIGSTTTTTGDSSTTQQGEDSTTSGGTISGGSIVIPPGSIGDNAKEYVDTTSEQMERIKQAPIVLASMGFFDVSLPSGVCPPLSFNLPLGIGHVGTIEHCNLIDYINSALYPLLLALWGLLGVMIFLRA